MSASALVEGRGAYSTDMPAGRSVMRRQVHVQECLLSFLLLSG
jgi:hypothetical protein